MLFGTVVHALRLPRVSSFLGPEVILNSWERLGLRSLSKWGHWMGSMAIWVPLLGFLVEWEWRLQLAVR